LNLIKTNWPDIKTQILRVILVDDLNKARELLKQVDAEELNLIRSLLDSIDDTSRPLKHLTAPLPKDILIATSYTCGIGCQMCSSGFADRTSIFDDYKYISPEQFDELLPWIDAASLVVYVGTGETLDNPHIYDFVKKSAGKPSTLITSGVSLTPEKIKHLIDSKLQTICFSYDGITSAGHGSGNEQYSKTILNRIDMIQTTKKELGSKTPHVMINMVLNNENADQLDDMIDLALSKNASRLLLSLMTPFNEDLLKKSIFTDFKYYQGKINQAMKRGNEKGLPVKFIDENEIKDSQSCSSVDRMLVFNEDHYLPSVCCGPITMPIKIKDESPDTYWNSFPFRYFRHMHDQGKSEALPIACDTCWAMHPLKFAEKVQHRDNNFDAYSLYLEASRLKRENQWNQAEKNFKTIIENTNDPVWRGKAYFHLAERKVREKNHLKAYELFQQTVKNYYEHQLAFAYLYLLMIILEKNQEKESFALEHMSCPA
jgi:MoaA/NifB/PqqE/SkfB family radical SAM enzyme